MNFNNASFVRKIIYLVLIAVLLLPIARLSQPASVSKSGDSDENSPGGTLSQLREKYNLSQAELGEIDPASETMKLATLGLRGIAVDILWMNAQHYQKVQDFNNLELTVKQIIRLQPNFLKVWDFQAHNLSYNTSVEFDSYRDRYQWVKKGIDFLILGTHYNRDEPTLLYTLGWYIGQKFGRSDENRQFRRLFRDDTDFHAEFRKNGVDVDQGQGLDGKPDSWLCAKLWYDKAEDAALRKSIRGKMPLVFYSGGPMAAINGASALEKEDGVYGQRAQAAWGSAYKGWVAFGNREIETSLGYPVRLNSVEELTSRIDALDAELDKAAPGAREALQKIMIADLKPEYRAVYEKPANERTLEEQMAVEMHLKPMIRVPSDRVAARAPLDKMNQAQEISDQIQELRAYMSTAENYRGVVNFSYWRTRCEAEQTQLALDARKLVRDADDEKRQGRDLQKARENYEDAWKKWAVIFKQFPALMDFAEGKELMESVFQYYDLLNQLDEEFPADFPLMLLLDMTEEGHSLRARIRSTQGDFKKPAETGAGKTDLTPKNDVPETSNPKPPLDTPPPAKPTESNTPPAATDEKKPAGDDQVKGGDDK